MKEFEEEANVILKANALLNGNGVIKVFNVHEDDIFAMITVKMIMS